MSKYKDTVIITLPTEEPEGCGLSPATKQVREMADYMYKFNEELEEDTQIMSRAEEMAHNEMPNFLR